MKNAKNSQLLRRIATATALIFAASGSKDAFADTFTDDFSAGLSSTYWRVSQTTTNFYSVEATQGGIQLAKIYPLDSSTFQNVAIVLNLSTLGGTITGDFSVQVDFTNAVVPGPGLDQVELHTYFQNGSYFLTVYDNSGGLNAHVWNGSLLGRTPVAGNAGTFRITRIGPTLTGYYNGTPLVAVNKSSPLVGIEFTLQNNAGSDDSTSVTFDNFSLTADSVAPRLDVSVLGPAQVQVSWATIWGGYSLECATNLPASAWAVVTNVPTVTGGRFEVTLDASDNRRFFRLHKQ